MKRFRWTCPDCGAGKNLGQRPARNATDRFCLKCSEKTGTLVERICPVLDKRRAAGKKRSTAKQKKKQERAQSQWVHKGVRFDSELKKVWHKCPELKSRTPTLTLHRSKHYSESSGRAWSSGRIHITLGTSLSDALVTLVHEVAHQLNWVRGGFGHDRGFHGAMADIWQEAYGTDDVNKACAIALQRSGANKTNSTGGKEKRGAI